MTLTTGRCLVLRLAGPMQSWGGGSMFNRRETLTEPTKSGLVGLLAAAQGRRRTDPIEDLLELVFGVRTDQPGTLLRDYHTVSDRLGRPLPSVAMSAQGVQKPTSPPKFTAVTERFYLQDAVFVVAIAAADAVLATLVDALRRPAFPLALGRRACPPTHPLLLNSSDGSDSSTWEGTALDVLGQVPWQAGPTHRSKVERARSRRLDLPVTLDDLDGDDTRMDLPTGFGPLTRSFTSRRVRQTWVHLSVQRDITAVDPPDNDRDAHDPFALLGW